MTLAFNNIFKGKQVVQQAWYGNKIKIFQSAGWETNPMTVQQVWQKKLTDTVYAVAVDSQDNVYSGDSAKCLTKFLQLKEETK